ncbi:MAG: hypothetical protein K2G24_00825 [Muribaculaceae bacterium]|nr:hypothetical protein [Muribaculaceae bacterium]
MPMKKISTPCRSFDSTRRQCSQRPQSPRRLTMEFLRQFARTYRPAPGNMAQAMPGYSLN